MIRIRKKLRNREKMRVDRLTEEAKRRKDVSAELFLESELNAYADADCFFFHGRRRRPAGLLTVFFPDEVRAEITVAGFSGEDMVFTELYHRALAECESIGIRWVYTVVDPAWGFELERVKGVSFSYVKSEYMLSAKLEKLAGLPGDVGKEISFVKEDGEEEDGAVRYVLRKDGRLVSECRILLMEDGVQPYLFGLKTEEAFRRQGFAAYLIREVANVYRKKSGERLLLQVASDNVPAVTLYRKLGFAPEEERAYYETKEQ